MQQFIMKRKREPWTKDVGKLKTVNSCQHSLKNLLDDFKVFLTKKQTGSSRTNSSHGKGCCFCRGIALSKNLTKCIEKF